MKIERVTIDLRGVSAEYLKEDLSPLLDAGHTSQLEVMLAGFAGKVVEVTFKEVGVGTRSNMRRI